MDTTETATCRYCHKTITRVAPSPFAELVRHKKPTDWTDEDGKRRCSAAGGAHVMHEPERLARI
jgi:hypothetical protein